MSKFKVGDLVVGNELSNDMYNTINKNHNFVGEVVSYSDLFPNILKVKVMQNDRSGLVGLVYNLAESGFELKEEVEKKTMNTKEAIYYLMDNPDKKLKMVKGVLGEKINSKSILEIKSNTIQIDGCDLLIYFENDLREYEVVEEKKLREMTWGEAYCTFTNNDKVFARNITSCVTGLSWDRPPKTITLEEYLGKWTIKGHYEN